MAEGLLFDVAEGILGKLSSLALREIGLWWGVKDEIELLRATVVGIKVVLLDAEGRQARGDDQVKDWLELLKEVAYDADDLLDDFSTEVLRRQVITGNKVTKEVRLFFSSSNRLAYGLKMGHKIKAIRERLDAVMRVGMKFASWLSSLTNLVSLGLYSCWKCRSLPALDQFPSLKKIHIGGLTHLEYINVRSCCVVGGGGGGGSAFFPSLETLQLSFCRNLKGWRPSSPLSSSSSSLLPQFQCLSVLRIDSCPNLTSMPAFPPSLEGLGISSVSFKSLEQMLKGTISPAHEPSSSSLPSILSSSLKLLYIERIEHLPEDFLPVELLQTLTSVADLRIANCPTLTCLPHAKMLLLTSLKTLQIRDCENLDLSNDDDDSNSSNNDAILWQGQGLRSLTSLHIDRIPKLVHLPRRLLLHSIVLRRLEIRDCPNLVSWPEWMPNLTSLQRLAVYNCSQLSERCKNNMSEDWPKIALIPAIRVDDRCIQQDGCYQL